MAARKQQEQLAAAIDHTWKNRQKPDAMEIEEKTEAEADNESSPPSASSKKRAIESALSESEKEETVPPAKRTKVKETTTATETESSSKVTPLPNVMIIDEDGEIELVCVDPEKPEVTLPGYPKLIDLRKDTDELADEDIIVDLDLYCSKYSQRPKGKHFYTSILKEPRDLPENVLSDRSIIHAEDDGDELMENRFKGPIFVTLGEDEMSPELPIPEPVVRNVREIVAGIRFIQDHSELDVFEYTTGQDEALGKPEMFGLSITTLFSTDIHPDEDGEIRMSTCVLEFEPEDGCDKMTISTDFRKNLIYVSENSTLGAFKPSQLYGDFFTFLATRRVGFSREAVKAYSLLKKHDEKVEIGDFEKIFEGFMHTTKSHRFLLTQLSMEEDKETQTGIGLLTKKKYPSYSNVHRVLSNPELAMILY